ncbi:hypothetical protein Tco_1265741 [Tanacetum coccineum]
MLQVQHSLQPPSILAWKLLTPREAPSSSYKQKSAPHSEQPVEDVPIPDDVNVSGPEDTDTAHLPKIKTRPDYSYQDPDEYKLLHKHGILIHSHCSANQIGKKKISKTDLEGPAFKGIRLGSVLGLLYKYILSHEPVTIQLHFFFNRDLEYLVSGDNERRSSLSISKLKAAHYLDFGLEELVMLLWIKSECDYDISAPYVRSHMRIFSVTSLKTYERYGYTYLREIVLRRADYDEYKISEADFKNLHPNDFEDISRTLSSDNMWQTCSSDYTIVSKSRAVIYRDRSDQKKMMRLNEVHKFSDGMLTRVLERLDHMVKDFRLFNYNPGMETRIWSKDDKRRSKEFMEVIERRLKIRRIFRSPESFMSRRLRDVDYRLIQRTE